MYISGSEEKIIRVFEAPQVRWLVYAIEVPHRSVDSFFLSTRFKTQPMGHLLSFLLEGC